MNKEEILLLITLSHCRKIVDLKSKNLIFQEVFTLKSYFDFDNHYNLLWSFYILKERIDLIDLGCFEEEEVLNMIKQFAQKIISKYKGYSALEHKLELLNYNDTMTSSTW